jgi:hypothetical protein
MVINKVLNPNYAAAAAAFLNLRAPAPTTTTSKLFLKHFYKINLTQLGILLNLKQTKQAVKLKTNNSCYT